MRFPISKSSNQCPRIPDEILRTLPEAADRGRCDNRSGRLLFERHREKAGVQFVDYELHTFVALRKVGR